MSKSVKITGIVAFVLFIVFLIMGFQAIGAVNDIKETMRQYGSLGDSLQPSLNAAKQNVVTNFLLATFFLCSGIAFLFGKFADDAGVSKMYVDKRDQEISKEIEKSVIKSLNNKKMMGNPNDLREDELDAAKFFLEQTLIGTFHMDTYTYYMDVLKRLGAYKDAEESMKKYQARYNSRFNTTEE